MKLKSALNVFNHANEPESPGVVPGLTLRQLAGCAKYPNERISVTFATFAPGTHEHLHWHLIETFHYVLSGKAIVRDIEGHTYDVGPGYVVSGPPGMRGAHEWEVKESLTLLSIKATTAPERSIQFNIEDKSTMESKAELDYLIARGAADLKESFY